MKKRNQLLALCALVVLVLTVFACENPFIPGKYKEPSPPQAPTVNVEASPIGPYIKGEGVTMTAKASASDGGELSYQWYSNTKNSSSGGKKISGATGESYRPSTDIEGTLDTKYYYIEAMNTLNGRTTTAASRTVDVTVYDTEGRTAIRDAAVNVNIPVEGDVPSQTAFIDGFGYACTGIAWTPQHNPFRGNVKYTARITLEALAEHTLVALRNATVNGQAVKFRYDPYDTGKDEVELEYTFSEVKTVTEIAVQSPATRLAYTHGDELNLSGLVVRLTYNTGEIEDVALSSFASRNITTNPEHDSTLSHTNHDGKPVVVSFAGLTANTANLTVSKAVITTANVNVTSPSTTVAPNTTATVDSNENYTCGNVSWSTGGSPFTGSQFMGSTVYAAAVTLTVKSDDYVFAQGGALTAEISSFTADVLNNTGTVVRISYTFAPTSAAAIDSLTVMTQPTKTNYEHGETLNLAGLVVTVNYDGESSENVNFADFQSKNIVTIPINGAVLSRSANSAPVSVRCGDKTANTSTLNISKKALTVAEATHTKVYDGNTDASSISNVTNVTFNGRATIGGALENISHGSVTAVYTHKNAGTNTINISALPLLGDSDTNYSLTLPADSIPVTGGITKKALTVTGASHTKEYDGNANASSISAVTNVTFNGAVSGETITYSTVTAVYIGITATTAHINISALTLTGDSNTNYTVNLPASDISVTGGITPKPLTITGAVHTKEYDGGTEANGISNVTFTGTIGSDAANVSVQSGSVTAAYTSAAIGTKTMQITAITLAGTAAGNYTVNLPSNTFTTSGDGITGITPNVKWPIYARVTAGAALSSAYIAAGKATPGVGNTTDLPGTFAFSSPGTTVALANSGTAYEITFTPTNTNYRSVTGNVNVMVYADAYSHATSTSSSYRVRQVRIPGGTFQMGQVTDGTSVTPVHSVTVSAFYMGEDDITQQQFTGIKSGFSWSTTSTDTVHPDDLASERPAIVKWYDAVEYCNLLSTKEGLTPFYSITDRNPSTGTGPITSATVSVSNWNANGYRLPTEAEWEYACKAGTTLAKYNTDTYTYNPWEYNFIHEGVKTTVNLPPNVSMSVLRATVTMPNKWGLFDMLGNANEWCWDLYGAYASGAVTNPTGASSGTYRVYRGGDYTLTYANLSSVARYNGAPNATNKTGFRVVRR